MAACWFAPSSLGKQSTVPSSTTQATDLPGLRRGGLLIGVWFINPNLDPGEEGPPYPLSAADLTALFAEGYEIVDDYVPDVAFPGREGR
jgi:hypothetical protein